ncbi:MAG: peptide deformylase [Chloroflexi bacterium]|nr:peptide deformylase [Chloroflexota bacterium]
MTEFHSVEDVGRMAKRNILVAGEPVLRQKAKKVTSFGPFLEDLVTDMIDTMRAVNGLGLAAPQIGVPLRLIVIEMPAEEDEEGNEIQPSQLYVYCNPEIVKAYGEEEDEEGCLSVPGYVGIVKRAAVVTVKGQDLKGRPIRTKAEGLLARAFQHEIDHLDGKLFLDRVESPEKLRRIEPRAKRQEQGAEPI